MNEYSAFGLKIVSEMDIPELASAGEGDVDVHITYGDIDVPPFRDPSHKSVTKKTPAGYVCYLKDIGGICVEDGSRITVQPLDGAEEKGFRFLVSGIALGILLHLRGFVTLHASAIALQNRVVGFVGNRGMGKSTTAAAFHAHDHPIVTDDLLVLDIKEDQVIAYPGFPHLKLYPNAIEGSLGEDPNHIPKINPAGTKRSYGATTGFSERPLPLRSLYILEYEEGDVSRTPYSETVTGSQACIELIRHSYVPRLLPEEAVSTGHFQRCARVVQSSEIRRLYREESFEGLQSIVALITEEQTITDVQEGKYDPSLVRNKP
jgi:hypothetical protein